MSDQRRNDRLPPRTTNPGSQYTNAYAPPTTNAPALYTYAPVAPTTYTYAPVPSPYLARPPDRQQQRTSPSGRLTRAEVTRTPSGETEAAAQHKLDDHYQKLAESDQRRKARDPDAYRTRKNEASRRHRARKADTQASGAESGRRRHPQEEESSNSDSEQPSGPLRREAVTAEEKLNDLRRRHADSQQKYRNKDPAKINAKSAASQRRSRASREAGDEPRTQVGRQRHTPLRDSPSPEPQQPSRISRSSRDHPSLASCDTAAPPAPQALRSFSRLPVSQVSTRYPLPRSRSSSESPGAQEISRLVQRARERCERERPQQARNRSPDFSRSPRARQIASDIQGVRERCERDRPQQASRRPESARGVDLAADTSRGRKRARSPDRSRSGYDVASHSSALSARPRPPIVPVDEPDNDAIARLVQRTGDKLRVDACAAAAQAEEDQIREVIQGTRDRLRRDAEQAREAKERENARARKGGDRRRK